MRRFRLLAGTRVRRKSPRERLLALIAGMRANGDGWRAVGAALGVPGATAHAIFTRNYEPRSPAIRKRLKLPLLALAPVCECGKVHTSKRCPNKRKPSYEENCAAYDEWRRRQAKQIAERVDGLTRKPDVAGQPRKR